MAVLKDSSSFVGKCAAKWGDLRDSVSPTQSQVGYAWIIYKVKKDFDSSDDAQDEMSDSMVPTVLGPDNRYFIVDKHHTLSALDWSGHDKTTVKLDVICDLRDSDSMEEFWKSMTKKSLVDLKAHPPVIQGNGGLERREGEDRLYMNDGASYYNQLPVPIDPSELPMSFEFNDKKMTFSNDPWRSLVSFSRKTNIDGQSHACDKDAGDYKYCLRCMYRGCDSDGRSMPFFEFQWGTFMNNASFYEPSLWPKVDADGGDMTGLEGFLVAYNSLAIQNLSPGSTSAIEAIDTDAWKNTASILIELCRFSDASKDLPGAVSGDTKLGKDPDCALPEC